MKNQVPVFLVISYNQTSLDWFLSFWGYYKCTNFGHPGHGEPLNKCGLYTFNEEYKKRGNFVSKGIF